ncbi:PilN domain-containing protein [Geobacter sp. FeAm09]|uniref:PilN domain-containing protein n=1 Tax=Geobacter sp. FeAm09 TaxID=2597769 RepID=UPI0011EE2998|nr:PilN domain-containing protein [Geobacter sp. FeAm09]QEM67892.1 PilN domain-containing protein [Geobacter sp. FeAm09]
MRFTINLATRTYVDQRLISQVCYTALALLALVLTWNVVIAFSNFGELQRLRVDIATYEGRLNSRPKDIPERDYTRLLADITFFNGVIERKAFNWLGLLDQVEEVTPEGIAVSSLAPDMKTGEVKIEGLAHSFANVRAFMEKFDESRAFTRALLLSHRDVAMGDKTRGVQFSLSCRMASK